MKKIVLTGGSSGGKSCVIEELKLVFPKKIVFIPEVASIIFSSGPFVFPEMNIDEQWNFQKVVISLQKSMEESFGFLSSFSLMICERGMLDGAAYMPGGLPVFCGHFNLIPSQVFSRYDTIFHLESIAVGKPDLYQREANNKFRYEDLKQAQQHEHANRVVWQDHPNYKFISCDKGLKEKFRIIYKFVDELLKEENG